MARHFLFKLYKRRCFRRFSRRKRQETLRIHIVVQRTPHIDFYSETPRVNLDSNLSRFMYALYGIIRELTCAPFPTPPPFRSAPWERQHVFTLDLTTLSVSGPGRGSSCQLSSLRWALTRTANLPRHRQPGCKKNPNNNSNNNNNNSCKGKGDGGGGSLTVGGTQTRTGTDRPEAFESTPSIFVLMFSSHQSGIGSTVGSGMADSSVWCGWVVR